jgi:hypothetical protein
MISNPGVAPVQSYTLLGASTKNNNATDGVIGCFGSGSKYGLGVLLRNRLNPIIYCGNLKLEFSTQVKEIDDGITVTKVNQLVVNYSGKTEDGKSKRCTEDLGFTLEYGRHDWGEISGALREFVSNAIDHTIKFNYAYNKDKVNYLWDGVETKIVDENQVRAKTGTTRVFIPLDDSVFDFHKNIGKWFLHFSEPENLNKTILSKTNRNKGDIHSAVVYRRGVLVCETTSSIPSMFDYNLNTLPIDESRKIDDYTVRAHAAFALAGAEPEVLAKVFKSDQLLWEHQFDNYYLSPQYNTSKEVIETRKAKWQKAVQLLGDNAVLVKDGEGEYVKRKGLQPVTISESFLKAANAYGAKTADSILNQLEKEGLDVNDADRDLNDAVNWCWSRICYLGMNNGKTKPEVKSFKTIMEAEGLKLGQYKDGVIYINQDLGTKSTILYQTINEELGHWITGSMDNSRDFQDWSFGLATKAMQLMDL